MTINPIPLDGFPRTRRPWNNITPFTYRDGLTYLEVLEELRAWVRDVLVLHINKEMAELGEHWETEFDKFQEHVENTINGWIENQIEANDAIVSTLVSNDSSTRTAMVSLIVAQLQSNTVARLAVETIVTASIAENGSVAQSVSQLMLAQLKNGTDIKNEVANVIKDDLENGGDVSSASVNRMVAEIAENGSSLQNVVDGRIDTAVAPLVSDALATDATLRQALLSAVSDTVGELSLMEATRGLLPDGSDFNNLAVAASNGSYALNSSFNYANAPEMRQGGTLLTFYNANNMAAQIVITEDVFTFREAIYAGEGEWGEWQRVADHADIPVPAASQDILELAKTDGWLAVYDPTNPHTRTMRRGNVMRLRDGLGNLPEMFNQGAYLDPKLKRGGMGELDSLDYRWGDTNSQLFSGVMSETIENPIFWLVALRDRDGIPNSGRFAISGQGQNRNSILIPVNGTGSFGTGTTSVVTSRDFSHDNGVHVIGGQFAGSSSTLIMDGVPQYITGVPGALTQSVDNFIFGSAGNIGDSNAWHGDIGAVLIYEGIPSNDVRDRMAQLLMSYVGGGLGETFGIHSESAALADADGNIVFGKDVDTPKIPASITKLVTGVTVLDNISLAELDDDVTVRASDNLAGSQLQDGDVVTYRDLLYLSMLPSDNAATRVLARVVGERISGTGLPVDKFVQYMNDYGASVGWTRHNFNDSSGLSTRNRLSARQITQLLRIVETNYSTLGDIAGTATIALNIRGANPRAETATHTIDPDGDVKFPGFVAGKTGSLSGVGNVAMIDSQDGSKRYVVTLRVSPQTLRYVDARNILDGNTHRVKDAETVSVDIAIARALSDPTSYTRKMFDAMM